MIAAADKAVSDFAGVKKEQEAIIAQTRQSAVLSPEGQKAKIEAAEKIIAEEKAKTDAAVSEAAGKVLVMRTTFAGWDDAVKVRVDALGRLVIAPTAP